MKLLELYMNIEGYRSSSPSPSASEIGIKQGEGEDF